MEAKIQFNRIPSVAAVGHQEGVAEVTANKFDQILKKTKTELLKQSRVEQRQVPNELAQHQTGGQDMDAVHQ